ncbi:MAG: FlgD immunoglobulin-like domain containing protein [Fidelibacterota bacterium]
MTKMGRGMTVLGVALALVAFSSGQDITSIYDIQYVADPSTDDASPLDGQEVTITGVVTAEFWGGSNNRQIFVQDSAGAWSGVMVFEYGGWDNFDIVDTAGAVVHSVAEGDSVLITGTVDEYYGKTEITDVTSFKIVGRASKPMAPITVSPGDIKTGSATAESYEGVLVQVAAVTVADADLGFGEWSVSDGTDTVRVDDLWDYFYWPEAGQALAEVVGPLDYTFGDYKIQPRLARDVVESGTTRIQHLQQVLYSDLLKAGDDAESDTSYVLGDTVTIEGIVTMPTGLSYAGAGVKFIYEDEHGGPWSAILSYDPDSTAFPVLFEGDEVRATGYVSEYSTGPSNMTELFITEPVEILDTGVDEPEVEYVMTGDLRWPTEAEQWGNVMVKVKDVTVIEDDLPFGEWSVDDGSGKVNVDDDSDSISVWQDTYGRPPVGTNIDSIRGWIYHHFGSYADSTAYKLEPLYPSDIVISAGPPSIRDVARDPCVPLPDDDVTVSAEVSDNSTVASVVIMYSVNGGDYQTADMTNTGGTSWSGTIPATGAEDARVDYYVKATDDGVGQEGPESTTYPGDTAANQFGYVTRSGDLDIADIQFTPWPAGDSPFNECEVTVTGIVTGDTAQYASSYGAYALQSETGPWNGVIFEWDGDPLLRGDEVTITGTVEEYDPEWHFKYDNNTKIIDVTAVTTLSSGNELLPQLVTTADLAQDADEVESYEGTLVKIEDAVVVSVNQYDWSVMDASGISCLIDDDMATDDADAFLGTLEEGQKLEYVTGIFNFSFGTYKIQVRDLDDVGEVTAVEDFTPQPYAFRLYPNFPNPFNPETRIRFEIPSRERVKLIIYDVRGYRVRTLVSDVYEAGHHVVNWDGRNDDGNLVSSGVYIYRVKAGKFLAHDKMTLIR